LSSLSYPSPPPFPPSLPPSCSFYQRYIPLDPSDPAHVVVDTACLSPDNHTYTDPSFVTMIISGAPGDVERNDGCPGNDAIEPFTPACSPGYGYGVFSVHNSTYLRWDFTAVETPIGTDGGRTPKTALRGGSSSSSAAADAAPVTYTDFVIIQRSKAPE
jgi:hypothetical protein